MVDSLREQGEKVLFELPGQAGGAADMGCDRRLELKEGQWVVVQI
jgi:ATP phosphoribosyltransferase regulatory subunit